MALEIINFGLIGNIDNLEEKLEGKLPINQLELIYLVNSWGRNATVSIYDSNDNKIKIDESKPKECYDLSKLDTNQITNMQDLFKYSNFNGDISSWDVSNVTDMNSMFYCTNLFNSNIANWNISKVTNMESMFYSSLIFNQNLNNWDVSSVTNMSKMFSFAYDFNSLIDSWNLNKVVYCNFMFDFAQAFKNKYNNSKSLPYNTEEFKEWFNLNKNRMKDIDLKEKHGEEIDNFFSKFTNINIEANSIQKKEI